MKTLREVICFYIVVLAILMCFIICGCTSASSSNSSVMEQEQVSEESETQDACEEKVEELFEPVKPYDDEGFITIVGEDIYYYSFDSMTYIKIPLVGIKTKVAGAHAPIRIGDKIYIIQHRLFTGGGNTFVENGVDNNLFVYDLKANSAEVIELPEEIYFRGFAVSVNKLENLLHVNGAVKKEDGSIDVRSYEISLDNYSVIEIDEMQSNENADPASEYLQIRDTGAQEIFQDVNGSGNWYGYSVERKEGVKLSGPIGITDYDRIIYRCKNGSDDVEVLTKSAYPGSYARGAVDYGFISIDNHIFYCGIDIVNQTISNFIFNTESCIVEKRDEKGDLYTTTVFLAPYAYIDGRLILTNVNRGLSLPHLTPEEIAVVDLEDYIDGTYEFVFFSPSVQ